MNLDGPVMPGRFPTSRGRLQALAVALVSIMGLAAVSAWLLARSHWWIPPIRQAEQALDAGDLSRARQLLTTVIHDEPRQGHARLLYARLLRLSGRPKDADVALGQAMDLGVPQASLWREYGLLIAASDFRKAERILLRASEAHPDDVEVLRALADGFSRQGRWPDAADVYSRWLRVEPNRSEALLGRSQALVQAGQSREAVSELRAILARQPDNYDARLLLANCFLSNADMGQAAPELERCRRLRPDRPEPPTGLATCAIEENDPDRARELLNQALALDPSHVPALISRANLALTLRQDQLALADFERVVTLDPTNKQGHMHLAQLFSRMGDRNKAGEHEQAFRSLQSDRESQFRTIRGMR
jgi:Tfp pilus assembly protein PilF